MSQFTCLGRNTPTSGEVQKEMSPTGKATAAFTNLNKISHWKYKCKDQTRSLPLRCYFHFNMWMWVQETHQRHRCLMPPEVNTWGKYYVTDRVNLSQMQRSLTLSPVCPQVLQGKWWKHLGHVLNAKPASLSEQMGFWAAGGAHKWLEQILLGVWMLTGTQWYTKTLESS